MNNEFKKTSQGQVTRYVLESASGGGTSAGGVASVSMPIGGTRKRGDNLIAQEEQKEAPKPRNFVAKNAKMGGAGQHKDKKKEQKQGNEKHKKPYFEDHEIQMASSELQSIAKNAVHLLDLVRKYSEQDGLQAWQQSKITKAADYLNSVLQSVSGEQSMAEAPIEMDPAEPMNPMIHSHQGANPAKLQYRMMRAAAQLKDLAQRAENGSAIGWESIARQFDELAMNVEQIKHALEELAAKRKKGGIGSRGIDPNIGEDHSTVTGGSGQGGYDTYANTRHGRGVAEDEYMMELAGKLAEKIPANAPTDVWIKDFQKANPNKYHQFKNKTPAKKAQMAVAASYAAKNPSKKK